MAKKKRAFSRRRIRRFERLGSVSGADVEIRAAIRRLYTENIHITVSIDKIISNLSRKFAVKSEEERFALIHTGLGVQAILDIIEAET